MGYKTNQSKEGIAECYIKLEDYEKAYAIYKQLVKEKYITPPLCNNLATLLLMHKHHQQALKYFKMALKLGNPNKERIEKNIQAIHMQIKKTSNKKNF